MDSVPTNSKALAAFETLYPRLLAVVREKFSLELTKSPPEYDRRQQEIVEDSARRFGETLRAVYSFGLYESLEKETSWLVSVLESRGFGREWVQKILETWTIGIQGLVEPREPESSPGRSSGSAPDSRAAMVPSSVKRSPGEDVQRYLDFALGGRRREAAEFAFDLS